MILRSYGIVVRHANGPKRLFGTVNRSAKGDVYTNWCVVEPPATPGVPAWKPHGSYHASGQVHSKSHDQIGIKKMRQAPGPAFIGTEPVEYTNADRALSPTLPILSASFHDTFEIDTSLISGTSSQTIAVDLVAPGASPLRVFSDDDTLVAEKVFRDNVPWISVRLVEPAI